MVPRIYRMDRREASAKETRKRIVEATLAVHCEKGIFGTSWKDIAERADVSVATVYKYFPSLEELVPACGELIYTRTAPPSRDDVAGVFEGADTLDERIERMLSEFFDFYERAEPYMEVGPLERQLPAVQEWEAEMTATREAFVREALQTIEPSEATLRAVSALLDFPVFQSFRRQDLSKRKAEEIVRSMLLCWLGASSRAR